MIHSKIKLSPQLPRGWELRYNKPMKLDVTHVAKLANLPLSEEEIKVFGKQLDETLSYIDQLAEIDTKNVKPTSHVTGLENVTRKDVAAESLTQKQALSNAKRQHEGFIEVGGLLDTD